MVLEATPTSVRALVAAVPTTVVKVQAFLLTEMVHHLPRVEQVGPQTTMAMVDLVAVAALHTTQVVVAEAIMAVTAALIFQRTIQMAAIPGIMAAVVFLTMQAAMQQVRVVATLDTAMSSLKSYRLSL